MKPLTVIIEKAENNYSAYLQEVDGIVATGKTVDEIKAGIINSINVLIEDCREFGGVVPAELKEDYELTFKMDVKSILQFYAGDIYKGRVGTYYRHKSKTIMALCVDTN